MRLRRLPEDFCVEELTALRPSRGPFALYRLTKKSIGTPEAVSAIVERWKIPRRRISYGGLKDRHAVTIQYLTIHQGPHRGLQQKSMELEYVGQTPEAFHSGLIDANRFRLVLRDMTEAEAERAAAQVQDVQLTGLPNYFDDQRFGSLGESGEWIGKAWCLGNYERALWLALADPWYADAGDEKRQKQILRELWGRWPECKQALARSHRRSIVTYLADKVEAGRHADFRGAFARISVDLRGLYLSAYQSMLWNRLLTKFQQACLPHADQHAFELSSGSALFALPSPPPDESTSEFEAIRDTQLPLPSARIDRPEGVIGDLLDQILQEQEMELRLLRVKYPRDSFFSKGSRPAFIQPVGISVTVASDELYSGRRKLLLNFQLPRGSYATILVKRLTEV